MALRFYLMILAVVIGAAALTIAVATWMQPGLIGAPVVLAAVAVAALAARFWTRRK